MTRKITDDEKKLWKHVTKNVKARSLKIDDFLSPQKVKVTGKISKLPQVTSADIDKFFAKGWAAPKVKAEPEKAKTKKKQIKVDAKIDLHGMKLDDAFYIVRRFIENSRRQKLRKLLVVTGKGAKGEGKIRAEFPRWLDSDELRPIITSHETASIEHGGNGAFYVYLKK